MNNRPRIERLWHGQLSPADKLLSLTLSPIATAYRTALGLRSAWWRRMASIAPVATISVGNLTVGGNGKTPLTLFLANKLIERGFRVGIVSRGYGAKIHGVRAALVADRSTILLSAAEAGDEPLMMAHRFAGPIAIARRRLDGIALLREKYELDAVVLDDAFQHLRLRRDLDIVAVSARRALGNGKLLPAGPLREPLTAVTRADAIVTVHHGRCETSPSLERLHHRYPPLRSTLAPRSLIASVDHVWYESPIAFCGRRVVAVSGLADPEGFAATLEALGAVPVRHLAFPDHHPYSPSDWTAITQAARDVDFVVTTEKDLVKLERFLPRLAKLRAIRLELSMPADDEERLLKIAADCIDRHRQAPVSSSLASAGGDDNLSTRRSLVNGC